jgi:DNA-binding LytR/AlgR family response regulator
MKKETKTAGASHATLSGAAGPYLPDSHPEQNPPPLTPSLKHHTFPDGMIMIATAESIELIQTCQIKRLSAERSYTRFHFIDGKCLLASRNIGTYERILSENGNCFYRLHESHIVNIHFIRRFLFEDGGILEMVDGTQIPVAKRRKKDFLEWLHTQCR